MARAIAGGDLGVRRAPPISALLGTITPLGHDEGTLDAAFVFAAAGIPIGFVTMPQGGSTTPITMAGSLVVGIAEALSGVCAVQAAFPGAPVFICFIPSVMDLHTGDFSGGAPEDTLMAAAVGNVGAFYGLPTQCGMNASAAKLPGWQSVIDDVTTTYLSMLAGVDMLAGVGMVAGGRIFSFEELILGTEVTAAARAAARAAAAGPTSPASRRAARLGPAGTRRGGRLARRRRVSDGPASRARDSRGLAREILATHMPPRSTRRSTPSCDGSWQADVGIRRPGRLVALAGLSVVALAAVLAFGVAACGGSGSGSSGQSGQTPVARFAAILGHQPTGLAATVAQRGTLLVGEDPEFAPQSSLDSTGVWSGFDIDVAREVGTVLGLKVEFVKLDWARVPVALASDRYDVAVSSMATDPRPSGKLAFAAPYTWARPRSRCARTVRRSARSASSRAKRSASAPRRRSSGSSRPPAGSTCRSTQATRTCCPTSPTAASRAP